MPLSPMEKINHLRRETESWCRLLDYIQRENSFLKSRLADFVSDEIRRGVLAKAEDVQNRSLSTDGLISLLKKDIGEFDNMVVTNILNDQDSWQKAITKQKKIRSELETLERSFNNLKSDFYTYFSETC